MNTIKNPGVKKLGGQVSAAHHPDIAGACKSFQVLHMFRNWPF